MPVSRDPFFTSAIATATGAATGAATDAVIATVVVNVACASASVKTRMLFYSMLLF